MQGSRHKKRAALRTFGPRVFVVHAVPRSIFPPGSRKEHVVSDRTARDWSLHDLGVMRQPRSRPPGRPRLVTLSSNRQVVIHKELCEELDLQAGDLLAGRIEGGRGAVTH